MLVLTRKLNQEILIADNIRVTVLEIQGNRIRLGVAAPDDITIHRAEIAPGKPFQRCPVATGAED
jgi:carbon storage regulator